MERRVSGVAIMLSVTMIGIAARNGTPTGQTIGKNVAA
jgi:hypothetical protein